MKNVLGYLLLGAILTSLTLADYSLREEALLERIESLRREISELEDIDDLPEDEEKVTGGTVVSKGEFPFLVSVKFSGAHSFTGSIISSRTVLTCAHCLQYMSMEPDIKNDYEVLIGVYNISEVAPAENKFKIHKFYIHPQYDRAAANRPVHDLGVLILDRAIDFAALNVKAAPLTSAQFLEDYTSCWVAGWGALNNNISWSEVPQKYPVKVMVDPSVCVERIREMMTPPNGEASVWTMDSGNVCAISDTANHCQGDSGAPMWCLNRDGGYHVQLALVSTTFGTPLGSKCGVKGGVSIYTGVGPHLQWIRNVQDTI